VPVLTLFAFSSENWQRPQDEVNALMNLFVRARDKEVEELHGHGVRLRFIGDLDSFDEPLRQRAGLSPRCRGSRAWRVARRRDRRITAGPVDEPGRAAAAGPVHPHRRRTPHQQLPVVAGRLRRAVLYRYVVARFRPGLPARGHRRLRFARAPLRPHQRAAGPCPPGAWAIETKGLWLRAFGQLFRSFSSDSYGYLPQTIEKPDSKSLCLAPLVSTAHAPRGFPCCFSAFSPPWCSRRWRS